MPAVLAYSFGAIGPFHSQSAPQFRDVRASRNEKAGVPRLAMWKPENYLLIRVNPVCNGLKFREDACMNGKMITTWGLS